MHENDEREIIQVINDGSSQKVRYDCVGKDNVAFVCNKKREIYEFTLNKFGDIVGWKINYDEQKEIVLGIYGD